MRHHKLKAGEIPGTLYKFTCSALYQSSEWSGGPEQAPWGSMD